MLTKLVTFPSFLNNLRAVACYEQFELCAAFAPKDKFTENNFLLLLGRLHPHLPRNKEHPQHLPTPLPLPGKPLVTL